MLLVIEPYPVQYHAPVYRMVQRQHGIPVTALYGSDASIVGYSDHEFGESFAWDVDLVSGYSSMFLESGRKPTPPLNYRQLKESLSEALDELRPEAVLLVGYSPRFYRVVAKEVFRRSFKILFRGETSDHAKRRCVLHRLLRDRWLKRFYRRCDRLLHIGKRSLEHYQRLRVPEAKLVSAPYCVATEHFDSGEDARMTHRDAFRASLGISDSETVYLFSGKLVPRKDPITLVEAIRIRREKQPQQLVSVLVVGDGALRSEMERFARKEPPVQVRFAGFRNQTELSPFYHSADVLVLPSVRGETWGLVVNEALHHGLPSVVSDAVGCQPDLVIPGESGEVFAAGDALSLSDALSRAASLQGRPEIRERCRRRVAAFSAERAAEGIAMAYRSVRKTSRDNGPINSN